MEEELREEALLRTAINVELDSEAIVQAEAGGALHEAFINGGRITGTPLDMR